MGYEIVRLVALDWPATLEAIRRTGTGFYWDERDEELREPFARAPFVAEYDGPLSACPSLRDPEANWIYGSLRPHLPETARAACDAGFARLFWDDGAGSRHVDLGGLRVEEVWNAVAPETVERLLVLLATLPWSELDAAAREAPPWDGPYLPTVTDLEHHVNNHLAFLEHAARRRAGVLGLVSA